MVGTHYYRSSIPGTKISISVSENDVALLDEYARSSGLRSRSAAIQHAIRLLRHANLEHDYASAWGEWEEAGEQAAWDVVVGDGLNDASR